MIGLIVPSALGYGYNFMMGLDPMQGALGGFLIAGVTRIVIAQHCTFFINSLCHTVGKQPYSTKHSARDSAIMALLTFGEGYHNYHHEFQHDYRNGVKSWQWDPSKWTIWTLSKLGLVEGLRRVPDSKILLAEMGEARRVAETQLAQLQAAPVYCQSTAEMLTQLYEKLCANYRELEQAVADRMQLSRDAIQTWQDETRALMRQFSQLAKSALA